MSLVHFIYDLTKRSLLCSFPLYNFTLCPLWGLSLFPFFMVTHKTLPCRFNKAYKQYLKTSPERQEPKDINAHCHFAMVFFFKTLACFILKIKQPQLDIAVTLSNSLLYLFLCLPFLWPELFHTSCICFIFQKQFFRKSQ